MIDPSKWPGSKVELTSVDSLIPYARNSRTHSKEQVAQIAASIKEWGFTNPILTDEDGMIIAGHGRVLAAQKLGLREVPVIIATGWTDAQKRAYVIADNKLAMNAGWDEDMLAAELAELSELDFDLGLTGFEGKELEKLLDAGTAGGDASSTMIPAAFGVIVECDNEDEQVSLLERFSAEGLKVKALI